MSIYCYYVYAYIRSKDSKTAKSGTPYYIGKGKGQRAWSKQHSISTPKDSRFIIILEANLSNVGALALERRYIKWYGRVDDNAGILRNLTDGGDGRCSFKMSEDQKQIRRSYKKTADQIRKHKEASQNRKWFKNIEGTKEKFILEKDVPENWIPGRIKRNTQRKQSSLKGRPMSEDQKQIRRKPKSNKENYKGSKSQVMKNKMKNKKWWTNINTGESFFCEDCPEECIRGRKLPI